MYERVCTLCERAKPPIRQKTLTHKESFLSVFLPLLFLPAPLQWKVRCFPTLVCPFVPGSALVCPSPLWLVFPPARRSAVPHFGFSRALARLLFESMGGLGHSPRPHPLAV